ncbi:hypothetical protein PV08_02987 [Exophiala spinifera]|uniref:Transcription factor domain-containing protein n=1 Tax=Exophiala spinifera TaxID=91928 RepID=A0A0D2BIA9_9EURO|nr:uncharacterized protein PV08_02987 [Exophiala spinifera]KIW18698.1 hypothetical protein PV08_02987 [Exophiala spinifera]
MQGRRRTPVTAASGGSQNSPKPTTTAPSLSAYRFATYDDLQHNSLPRLAFEMDEYSHGMVKYLFTNWIPSLYPQKLATVHHHRLFEMVYTDSITCAIFLTYGFSQSAFELVEINCQQKSLTSGDGSRKRYLFRSKEACLRMMREMFTTSWPMSARRLFFASVSLSGCAFIVNNPEEGRMHLQGAVNIAEAIGGFRNLGELELEASLLWDVHLASLTGQKPVISGIEVSHIAQTLLPQVPEWLVDSGLRFSALFEPSLSSDDKSDVCGALRGLFYAAELINADSTQSEDRINETLIIRTLVAGHQLSRCAPTTNSTDVAPEHNICTLESLRLAGMLAIFTTHLKATRKIHLFEKVSRDLEVLLRRSDVETCWRQYPEIMMWIFFAGAHGSPNVYRTQWFIQNISRGAHSLGIDDWHQARMVLRKFPYIVKEFDKPFEDMWNSSQPGFMI